jgi:hypothetical protein
MTRRLIFETVEEGAICKPGSELCLPESDDPVAASAGSAPAKPSPNSKNPTAEPDASAHRPRKPKKRPTS